MRSGTYEATSEGCGEKVSESITLLQHTGDETACFFGAIFQGGRSSVTIESSHSHAEKGPTGKKLGIRVAEPGAELKDDEEDVIHNEWPFAAPAIGGDTCS